MKVERGESKHEQELSVRSDDDSEDDVRSCSSSVYDSKLKEKQVELEFSVKKINRELHKQISKNSKRIKK